MHVARLPRILSHIAAAPPSRTLVSSIARSSIMPRVLPVPVHSDNFAYLLYDEATKVAAAIDPAQPAPVLQAARALGLSVSHVLTTHHHWDHADGNKEMAARLPSVCVVGSDSRIPALTTQVGHRDTVQVGPFTVTALATPCHTSGHLLYFIEATGDSAPLLFTGDTLFVGGCGRFFEGTAEQMHHNLNNIVASLPDNTQIYCGHEYTVKNLQFAHSVLPNNKDIQDKLQWAQQQRAAGKATIPSTVGAEKTFNPFMMVALPEMRQALKMEGASDVEVMARLRALKDKF